MLLAVAEIAGQFWWSWVVLGPCSMRWLSVQEGLPRAHGHHAAGALLMVCCDSSTMRVEDDVAFFLRLPWAYLPQTFEGISAL